MLFPINICVKMNGRFIYFTVLTEHTLPLSLKNLLDEDQLVNYSQTS